MKKYLLVFALIGILQSKSYAQSINWAISTLGSGSIIHVEQITHDTQGNLYIVGYWNSSNTVNFGTTLLNSPYGGSFFLAKVSASGQFLWAKTATGGGGQATATGVATDNVGNVYLTGYCGGVTYFSSTLYAMQSIYFAKYDSNGNALWAKNIVSAVGGNITGTGNKVVIDGAGNPVFSGNFISTSNQASFGNTVITTTNSSASYVTGMSPSGNFLWANKVESSSYPILSVFGNKTYVSGLSIAGATYGSYTASLNGLFVACLDTTGTFTKYMNFSSVPSTPNDIKVDSAGTIYVVGDYTGTPTIAGTALPTSAYTSLYILKLDTAEAPIWIRSAGSPAGGGIATNDIGYGIAVNGNTVFVTGTFVLTANFGSLSLTSQDQDIFISTLDTSGTFLTATRLGSSGIDHGGKSVTVDNTGAFYVTGEYSGTAMFGSTALTAGASSYPDIFVFKYVQSATGIYSNETVTNNFVVFPNPANNFLKINCEFNCEIKLLNNLGQIVFSQSTGSGTIKIDISRLHAGMYFIQQFINGTILTKKFQKL